MWVGLPLRDCCYRRLAVVAAFVLIIDIEEIDQLVISTIKECGFESAVLAEMMSSMSYQSMKAFRAEKL